ncbi:MAG: PTS sugar transporter subunit IIA [Erysipelotrichaceae bacterium]
MKFDENHILTEVVATSKKDLLDQLVQVAFQSGAVSCVDDYRTSIQSREDEISTNMGNGIAIPHGRSLGVNQPFFIFAKLNQAIIWNREDDSLVDLVFLLGVPQQSDASEHLRLLSRLAGRLVDDEFVTSLREVNVRQEAVKLFESITF